MKTLNWMTALRQRIVKGRCKICGYVGHRTYQCVGFDSKPDREAALRKFSSPTRDS